MPYQNEVRPLNLFGDFLAGKQAAIDQQGAQQNQQLRGLQMQGQQQQLEQNKYQFGQQQQMDKQQAFQQAVGVAQKALGIPDMTQRKAFLSQALQVYGPAFQALGADMSQSQQMLAMPDADLTQKLQQVAQFATPQKPIEVAAGASLVTPSAGGGYQSAFTAPSNPGARPNDIQEYEYARQQGYKGSFQQYQLQMKQAGAQQINLPSGYRWGAGGAMEFIPGGPADPNSKNKPPTEGDKKNAVLFSSMTNAEDQIAKLESAPGGATDTSSIANQIAGTTSLTKPLQSDAFRKYESAALRWSANLLYLKSGATATPDEVQSTRKQFFPQPGDGPEVKAQKEEARRQEVASIRQNMVPGAQPQLPSRPGQAPASGGWTIKKVK